MRSTLRPRERQPPMLIGIALTFVLWVLIKCGSVAHLIKPILPLFCTRTLTTLEMTQARHDDDDDDDHDDNAS